MLEKQPHESVDMFSDIKDIFLSYSDWLPVLLKGWIKLLALFPDSSCGPGEVSWPALGHDGPQGPAGHQPGLHTDADCGRWRKPLWVSCLGPDWVSARRKRSNVSLLLLVLRVCVVVRCLPECVPVSRSEAGGYLSLRNVPRGSDCGHSQVPHLD